MLDMSMEKNGSSSVCLSVGGDLTVTSINGLYSKIREIFNTEDDLELSIKDKAEIDMTFIQLICSSHRAFSSCEKKFSVSGNKACLYSKTDEIGYTRHKGCVFDKYGTCVLVKREA